MDIVNIRQRPPELRSPVLVTAFKGWNDAGEAATGAVRALRRQMRARAFAGIDPEEFFDFQVNRPTVRLVSDGERRIDWPRNRFSWAELPGGDRHVLLLDGTEPNLRWRGFAGGIVDLATKLGVRQVVTLGALQIDVPHTRPVPVTGSASDATLRARLGLGTSRYEGPTGIVGVLGQACAVAGLSAVSMWAGVPHYLAGTPYLTGALALAERVVQLLGTDAVSLEHLARDAAEQRDDIGELVAQDEDLARYVSELEERSEAAAVSEDTGELPAPDVSGEELAEELERYLRERPDR